MIDESEPFDRLEPETMLSAIVLFGTRARRIVNARLDYRQASLSDYERSDGGHLPGFDGSENHAIETGD